MRSMPLQTFAATSAAGPDPNRTFTALSQAFDVLAQSQTDEGYLRFATTAEGNLQAIAEHFRDHGRGKPGLYLEYATSYLQQQHPELTATATGQECLRQLRHRFWQAKDAHPGCFTQAPVDTEVDDWQQPLPSPAGWLH